MSRNATAPLYPIGPFELVADYGEEARRKLIDGIAAAPANLRAVVAGLSNEHLDTKYRNWTIRQIVHHIADSHLHSVIRFKWALTEDNPLIKAYEEADWVQLTDSAEGDIEPALALLDGLHQKWVQLLESMTPDQYSRTFQHPQTGETVDLWNSLNYYPWHSQHHTGQILWLRNQHSW